ncbi:hypothetical protein N657DRAFT_635997 [Parathielavia appendiculata]|uniref:FHA domain-containing protein n=1 Tax=Parathielavia appendiculata TaxID=2587402 RepID=A0AAN6TX11_9PEZI|nr:hypothetical protein N657DRAFT_635997 [Parathielavia appendiculata]
MTASSDHTKSAELRLYISQYSGTVDPFPERRIIFTETRNVVSVGRSSKVSTKGFIAGADNVWVDNPVMSRLHAQFTARMDINKIEIKDLGSLHGTFLNEERIPADQGREVNDGDTLRFGAPISRGKEEFLPTTAKVAIVICDRNNKTGAGTSGTGTFQVPDDSDDDGASDDDQNRLLDGHTPVAQKGATRTATEVIDLTDGYADRQVHREVVDLSSPCGSPIRIDDDVGLRPVETEDDRMELAANDDSMSHARQESVRHENWDCNGDLPHLDEILGVNRILEAEHRHWYDSEEDDDFEDDEIVTNTPSEYSNEESEVDYPEEEESDSEIVDDDDPEDKFDDGMDETESDDDYPSDRDYSPNDHNHSHWEDLPLEEFDYPEIMPLVDSLSRPIEAPLHARQSDSRQEPGQAETGPSANFDAMVSRAEVLGVIAGKPDFFLAREHNKIAMVTHKAAVARPTSSVHALCNPDESGGEPSSYRFGPAEASSRSSATYEESAGGVSSPAIANSATISNGEPDGCFGRTRVAIPDIVDPNQPSPSEGKLKRKAEEISETTQEQEAWAAKATKAPTPAPLLPSERQQQQEQQPESSEQHAEPQPEPVKVPYEPSEPASQVAVSIASSRAPGRPLKRARMMRVAERLGYAALGGVTAGAMVLGTLIYTAPTFG